MKKIFCLTSVLALAACGGGSGGGGAPTSSVVLPERAALESTAMTSNGKITSMSSEILVPTNSADSVVARVGSVNFGGKNYTSYRLEDVNFRVATGVDNAFLNFNVDEQGRIDSLVMNVGNGDQHMDRRDFDTADFRGIVYEYVVLENSATANDENDNIFKNEEELVVRLVLSPTEDATSSWNMLSSAADGKCPEGRVCRWDRIDQAFRVTSGGKTYGLKYSDFGKLQTSNFGKFKGVTESNFADAKAHTRTTDGEDIKTPNYSSNWDAVVFDNDFDVFSGGYKVSALQHRPDEAMNFEGTAIGSLYSTNSVNHDDDGLLLVDESAKLKFYANGTEELAMDFSDDSDPDVNNWYKVKVTKNADGSNNITFSDFGGDASYNSYKFRKDTTGTVSVNNFTTTAGDADADGHIKTEGLLDMGYYGIGATEEATGMVRFKETANEGGTKYEREFRAGYGMKPVTE